MSATQTPADRWLLAHSGRTSRRQIAADLGINRDSFNKAVGSGRLTPELSIAFAHRYGMSAVAVLEHFGWITPQDIAGYAVMTTESDRDAAELVIELQGHLRRAAELVAEAAHLTGIEAPRSE